MTPVENRRPTDLVVVVETNSTKGPPMNLTPDVIRRFQAKVAPPNASGCTEWTAATNAYGYGVMKVHGKVEIASRIAWTIANGDIPEGKYVLHSCDNPPCVSPSHLWIGTHLDNLNDMDRKGRRRGVGRPREPKLTREQAEKIRLKYENGSTTHQDLADEYEVSKSHIGYITRREIHV